MEWFIGKKKEKPESARDNAVNKLGEALDKLDTLEVGSEEYLRAAQSVQQLSTTVANLEKARAAFTDVVMNAVLGGSGMMLDSAMKIGTMHWEANGNSFTTFTSRKIGGETIRPRTKIKFKL